MFETLRRSLRRLIADVGASTATTFALAAVALLGAGGAAVDYTNLSTSRALYQQAADAAALAGAKEFRLGNAALATVSTVVETYARNAVTKVAASATGLTITPTIDTTAKTVKVVIGADHPTYVMQALGTASSHIEVSATARVVGGAPICVIGLDTTANSTVLLDKTAHLEATACSVYSDSTKSNGLMAMNSAVLKAAFICSAGGKYSPGPGSFSPDPQIDCPVIPDPLASRPQPTAPGCLQTGLVVDGITTMLTPGTYCGGLTITNGANVTLSSGVYAFKGGPLTVSGNATLTGANVGLFFTGAGAVLNLAAASNVTLTAPKSGDMAGMLIFEDRASPTGQVHQILSNNARTLLGTIYLPQNRLHIAANSPVADQSAYTIVVARLFTLSEGPTMVLNANYGATNIPVPDGVGPNANRTALSQ